MSGDGPTLLSRNWLTLIRHGVKLMLEIYLDLFRGELGTMKGVGLRLSVPKDAVSKFKRPRHVLYALRGAIE